MTASPSAGGRSLEELPEWQNPDGEALLAAALRQEQWQPSS